MTDNLTTIAGLDSDGLLPKPLAQEILAKVQEQSIVTALAGTVPVPLEGNAVAVQTGYVDAGVVGEGEAKPVSSTSYGTKYIKPIKLAAITVHSKEMRLRNPLGVLDNIEQDMQNALTRAVDLAVLYGLNAKTGTPISGVESVNSTPNRVRFDSTAKTTNFQQVLLTGYDLVAGGDQVNDEFSGFAADTRLRSALIASTDSTGRPLYQASPNLADKMGTLMGLPAVYGKAVSSRIGAASETGVRAFGGDWSSLRYGFAENITLSVSDQATIVDGDTTYHLWQQNLEAFLMEAIVGWVITDTRGFVAYEDTSFTPAATSASTADTTGK